MMKTSYMLFFKALANPTRFDILQLLRTGPRRVTDICRELNLEQSLVSHNLKCLVSCGFVDSKQDGRNRVYFIDETHIRPLLEKIDEHIREYEERLHVCGVLQ